MSRTSSQVQPLGDVKVRLYNSRLEDGAEENGFPEDDRSFFYKDNEEGVFNMSEKMKTITFGQVLAPDYNYNCELVMRLKKYGITRGDVEGYDSDVKSAVVMEVSDGKENGILMRVVYEYTCVVDSVETKTIEPEKPKDTSSDDTYVEDNNEYGWELDSPVKVKGPGWLEIKDSPTIVVQYSPKWLLAVIVAAVIAVVVMIAIVIAKRRRKPI